MPAVVRTAVATVVRSVLVALVLVTLVGCAPQTPDHESWTDSALQALDDSGGEVATARLVLTQSRRGLVTRSYEKVVTFEAEEAAGRISDSFSAKQPPTEDDADYRAVTTALSDAADLLADVRIAVERADVEAYPDLLEQLARTEQDLTRTGRELAAR